MTPYTNAERLVILADLALAFPGTRVHLCYGPGEDQDEVCFKVTKAATPMVEVRYFEKSDALTSKKTSKKCSAETIIKLIRDIYPKDATRYSTVHFSGATRDTRYLLYAATASKVTKAKPSKTEKPMKSTRKSINKTKPTRGPGQASSSSGGKAAKTSKPSTIPPWTEVLVPIDDPDLL